MHRDATPLAMQQQLHASEPALQLTDARNGTDCVEALWSNRFDILALGYSEDEPIRGGQRSLDGAQRSRATGPDGRRDSREENHFA